MPQKVLNYCPSKVWLILPSHWNLAFWELVDPVYLGFGRILGSASGAEFPISLSNHVGFMPRLCYSSASYSPESFTHLKTGWAHDAWLQWLHENWYFHLDISRWHLVVTKLSSSVPESKWWHGDGSRGIADGNGRNIADGAVADRSPDANVVILAWQMGGCMRGRRKSME